MKEHVTLRCGLDYVGVGLGAMTFRRDGQVFLSRRAVGATNERGCWEFPGGRLEFGEKLNDGIRREFREECGIDIQLVTLLGVFDQEHLSQGQGPKQDLLGEFMGLVLEIALPETMGFASGQSEP